MTTKDEVSDNEAPEEVSINDGKLAMVNESKNLRSELYKLKERKKTERKRKQQKLIDQKIEKNLRISVLESKKLSQNFLNSIAEIETKKSSQSKQQTLSEDSENDDDQSLCDDIITLKKGVHVKSLKNETEKSSILLKTAKEQHDYLLYGNGSNRMPSLNIHRMRQKIAAKRQ